MNNYKQLFKNKNFFSLWFGQFVSSLGDRFTQMSLLTIVMILTSDTGERMAWVTFYSLLPFLLFGQIFGVISDRHNRKFIMIAADIIRAGLICLIPFVNKNGSFSTLYLIIFSVGTLSALFSPAKMAIIPNIVPKEKLVAANSLVASTGMVSTLIGTLIAGLIIQVIGPNSSFYADSFTFLVSAFMIWRITTEKNQRQLRQASKKGIFADVLLGLRFINRHQLILRIVQLNAVFAFFSSFFYITILNYSTTVLGLTSSGYGILLACLGLGLCSGALLLGKRVGRLDYNQILTSGFFLVALMNLLFLLKPGFFLAIIFLIIGGSGASLVMITLDSLLQRSTPDSIRANVFGARGIVTNAIFLTSLILVGKFLKAFGPMPIFGLMSLVSLLTSAIIFLSMGQLGYRIIKGALRLICSFLFDLKVQGLNNLPSNTKAILAGNHTSLLDGVVLMAAYPYQIYFLVADSVFKVKFIGFLARQLGFIPIKRGGFNKDSIREAVRILESNKSIGIFPEGRISPDGKILQGKKGVAVIAKKTNTRIIPFAIDGAHLAWPLSKKYPRRYPVEVSFGQPLKISEHEDTEEIAAEVMEQIKRIKTEMKMEGLFEVEPNVIVKHLLDFS
ncbi:MAG: MFS transporter [Candidatus Omnitrophica bacterium]|nr:MFS transporter [Candidatus Omnitrophota bacterium]